MFLHEELLDLTTDGQRVRIGSSVTQTTAPHAGLLCFWMNPGQFAEAVCRLGERLFAGFEMGSGRSENRPLTYLCSTLAISV